MSKGVHYIIDAVNVPIEVCLDDRTLLDTLVKAASYYRLNIIGGHRYRFGANSPQGCTGMVMLDESHISAHTYAKEGRMALDVFVCGESAILIAPKLVDLLIKKLHLETVVIRPVERFYDLDILKRPLTMNAL